MTTNSNKLGIIWTLDKILATKIEFTVQIMADINLENGEEFGQKLYSVLECYLYSLIRQHKKFTTDPEEFQEMKSTIHSIDELFHEMKELPEMEDWYYGMQAGNSIAHALGNLLIQTRNELLMSIFKYTESRKYSALSPETQRVLTFVTGHMDVHRLDSAVIGDKCLVTGARINYSDVPRVFKELRQSGLINTRQRNHSCEYSRTEPYWTAQD